MARNIPVIRLKITHEMKWTVYDLTMRNDADRMIAKITRQEAIAILEREPLRHFTMRSLLNGTRSVEIYASGACLLAKDSDSVDGFSFLAVDAEQRCELLLPLITGEEELIHVQGDKAAEFIRRTFRTGHDANCIQLYLPDSIPVMDDTDGIVDLKPEDAEYILSHYDHKDVTTVEYLRSRIRSAPAVGVKVDGILAGFVMTHEELTMGVMQVLPEYRRLGLATRLNAALVLRMRALGHPCLVEIVQGNTASLALAKAVGYVPLQKTHWIHLRHET